MSENIKSIGNQRRGKIHIAAPVVLASWRVLCEVLFCQFAPYLVQALPDGRLCYFGFCEAFDEIGPADAEPEYLVSFESVQGANQRARLRRKPDDPPTETPPRKDGEPA